MKKSEKILGLIVAKGNSNGVPGKNKRLLAGQTIVERAYRVARASECFDRIILSTDDAEIIDLAKRIGLEAPFVRPASLCLDTTAMIDVVLHALDELAKTGYEPTAVFLLQPTSPLRRTEHIRRGVEKLGDNDAVCSLTPVRKGLCPHYLARVTEDGMFDHFMQDGLRFKRRQDVPQAYVRDGTVYLTRVEVLRTYRDFYGKRCVPLILDPNEVVNIDEPEDWALAEERLSR